MADLARAGEWRQQGLLSEAELQAAKHASKTSACMFHFPFRNIFWVHVRRQQCIIIASESVPSEKHVPSTFATLDPRTPKQCKVGCQLS